MSTQPLNGIYFSGKYGFRSTVAVLAACAAFALPAQPVRAASPVPTNLTPAQAAVETAVLAIAPTKNIYTVTGADLALAVSNAITSSTFTAAQLAAAPFMPMTVSGKVVVRADRSTSAPLVVTDALDTVLATSGTNPNFASQAAAVVDSVITVNGTNTKQNLTLTGQEGVLKNAVAAVSDEEVVLSSTAVLVADKAIGNALNNDAILKGLAKSGLTTILENGISKVTGAKGKDTTFAPQAAQLFVAGVLESGTTAIPNGATLPAFGVSILSKVSTNSSIDELVSYQIGLASPTQSDLTALGEALVTKYAKEAVKIVQGVTAAMPAGTLTEVNRQGVIQALAAAETTKAAVIAQGASFTDPFYAAAFTNSVFKGLISASVTEAKLSTAATAIATAEGNVLGQDGAELTNVANVFATLSGSLGALPVTSVTTYATSLIKGAVTSKIPLGAFTGAAAGGGGGTLYLGSVSKKSPVDTPFSSAQDLASILDLFADAIAQNIGTLGVTKAATDIGNLAKAIAQLTTNNSVVLPAHTIAGQSTPLTEPVAVYLAGTLGDYIAGLSLGGADQASIFSAIVKGITAVTMSSIDTQVQAVLSGTLPNYTDYTSLGALSVQETTVTNL